MDESVQKSCWGVAARAVIGVGGVMLLVWLLSGPANAAQLIAG